MKSRSTPLPRADTAPDGPADFPDTGIGRGWEGPVLVGAVLLLLAFGLVNLYSASSFLAQRQGHPDYFYVLRQAGGAGVGLAALLLLSRVPYRWWRPMAWPLLAIAWVLLLLLVLPWTHEIAPVRNGARRWLEAGVTVQPSEIAKVAVVIWTAMLAVRKQELFRSLTRGLLPFLLIWGVVILPILLQPDLSTAVVVGAAGALVVFAAGGRIAHLLFLGALLVPLGLRHVGTGFRADRLLAFQEGEALASGVGYQTHQALVALGSGGLGGVGFGEGRQKFGFLPEPHNDFIFAMIGEEWGFLGVSILMALYLAVVLVGFRIARRAPDRFGQFLAVGIASLVALQAVLHMGVSLGLVPPTGLPLPLVSYGRSNLVMTLAAVGILLSIARAEAVPGETDLRPRGARG